ncbi:hypothetical protein ACPUVO_18900 [Pseudocolwellia sp. HL-MZ19]|uniref:hypothetical protein n=1 Tax=Pseudocolwellia sp. HL-MZ19 TaxID=3400846 RepID=UPI003CE7E2B9
MAKCKVITGIKGSTKNQYDISVPKKYKIDENSNSFVEQMGQVITEVFDTYETNLLDFHSYIKK